MTVTPNWMQILANGRCIAPLASGSRCKEPADVMLQRFYPEGGFGVCWRHEDIYASNRRRDVWQAWRDRPSTPEPERFVYYARQGDYIKIGSSGNVTQRMRDLARELNTRPRDLPLGPVQLLATHAGGRRSERTLHRRFKHLRVRGEWFRATPDLLAHISRIKPSKEHQ